MKTTRDLQKTEKATKNRNEQNPAKTTNTMTIEEAREAEKAFNEELEIFKEATRLNRKLKEE